MHNTLVFSYLPETLGRIQGEKVIYGFYPK